MRSLFLRLITLVLISQLIPPAVATAVTFNSAPATNWGFILASDSSNERLIAAPRTANLEGTTKSEWKVNYKNFPENAQRAVQQAVDIWSRNFESKIPVNVDAIWEPNKNYQVLGAARAGYYFNAFPGAPDEDLWYPSALANTLAEKDLNPSQSEIVLSINSSTNWYLGLDGKPTGKTYDLVSVVLHEIAHGLGFMSNAQYDKFLETAYLTQPTPFDAYVQLPDGKTFNNFCSSSNVLGKAMVNPLVWSGELAVTANSGVKPKLYTPATFEDGSSISHLDETTFTRQSPNVMMTPNMEQGEVFTGPGPIALAMIQDMLRKPPAILATGVPAQPLNVKAIIGDKYAIIDFDTPECRRIDRVQNYKVTIKPTGETRTFKSAPYRITGLKNGRNYSFEIMAENAVGTSAPVTTDTIKPKYTPTPITIDPNSRVSTLASTTFRGKPTIIYGDSGLNKLKMAVRIGEKWKITVVRRGLQIGEISICKSGTGAKEKLHVFYGELSRKDLIHSSYNGKRWDNETVDGNGISIQDYKENDRRKTASEVSMSNGCAITKDGIQVFYRDESQGILLGATNRGGGWEYEIVDGNLDTGGRTSGDVAFNLSVLSYKDSVYLLYNSVLSFNTNKVVTSGEVRLAVRDSAEPEDWIYETLDGPKNGKIFECPAVSLSISNQTVSAAWVVHSNINSHNESVIKIKTLMGKHSFEILQAPELGSPDSLLSLENTRLFFGCQKRICVSKQNDNSMVSGLEPILSISKVVKIEGADFLPFITKKKLQIIQLK